MSSSVVADSFRLRNRQLLLAANRYGAFYKITEQEIADRQFGLTHLDLSFTTTKIVETIDHTKKRSGQRKAKRVRK